MGDTALYRPKFVSPQKVRRCRRTDTLLSEHVTRARAVLVCYGPAWAIEYMCFNRMHTALQKRILLLSTGFRGD